MAAAVVVKGRPDEHVLKRPFRSLTCGHGEPGPNIKKPQSPFGEGSAARDEIRIDSLLSDNGSGKLLAVASNDSVIRLLSADNGKIVHKIEPPSAGGDMKRDVSCLGWAFNFTDQKAVRKRLQSSGSAEALDDVLARITESQKAKEPLNLPKDLAQLDIEISLPKLGVLPSIGRDEEVFSSRASLDALFHKPPGNKDDAVDVLIVGLTSSAVNLSIYDCFDVGNFNLERVSPLLKGSTPLLHASHPFSSSHTLLAVTPEESSPDLLFIPLDLRFISSSGGYLSLLASKSTQLQNLLRYVNQIKKILRSEWKAAQDLPTRFMGNIDATLGERRYFDWVHAAYHLVVTGHCYREVKEWLVDELSERGHKRWDKSVTSGYESVRRLTHENLLPALERCKVIVSRLRGLSRFQDTSAMLGLSTQSLNNVMNVIDCLNLMAHNMLKYSGEELRQFSAFSTWLRHEIDTQAAELTASSEDLAEKDPGIDHAKVLDYIQGAMTLTKLTPLLAPAFDGDATGSWLQDKGSSVYQSFKDEFRKFDSVNRLGSQLPNLDHLTSHFERQCSVVFKEIAIAQRHNVLFGAPIFMTQGSGRPFDARMLCKHYNFVTYLLVRSYLSDSLLNIFRVSLSIENGVSRLDAIADAQLKLGDGKIEDAKFIDDDMLMVIWAHGKDSHCTNLLKLNYDENKEDPPGFLYHSWSDKQISMGRHRPIEADPSHRTDLSNERIIDEYTYHTFQDKFQPERLEINGRKGRRVTLKSRPDSGVIMDVNQVLEATLSPDATLRTGAEQQLIHAAEVDFSAYLVTLAKELANEQAQPHIRTAAGLALKNAFSSRETVRLQEVQQKWLDQVDPAVKKTVKDLGLQTLSSNDSRAGQSAAQFISSIAAIEIPRDQWPELMPTLVQNVGEGGAHQKQASLSTIGIICQSEDIALRESLTQHSNAILTAVVQGARKEEPSADVRNAAIIALGDSLEFVRTNFETEGERNYIMQVICEATQSDDSRVQQGAFGCLNRIMALYYDKMRFYMEKALFGLTIMGMKSEEEDVAKLAVEFWSTVCEEEISIEDDNSQASAEGSTELRPFFNFARVATPEVLPVLLTLLTKQEDDAAEDDFNVSRAAYQCLQLYSQAVGNVLVAPVLGFVENNLRDADWHKRDAAVSAFGAMMDGPDHATLEPLVKQALPILIAMMDDKVVQVKDSAAYALGRICETVPEAIDPVNTLPLLISSLFTGLSSNPKMASSCCWALMNLSDRFAGEPGCEENALSKQFQDSVTHLLQVTERNDADNQLRTAAYEVLSSWVMNAAGDSLEIVASLSHVILERLERTIPMINQLVSIEDKITLEEMQTSLCSVLLTIIQRVEGEIRPQADRIMTVLLQLLQGLSQIKSSVPDIAFATVGGLSNAIEEDFAKYMDAFVPFLYGALGNQEEVALCGMAIGLVSDITRSLGETAQPYCDTFMNYLLNNLRDPRLNNQFKPAILQCFGDIAQAIGGHFETYLSVVAQVLQQAGEVTVEPGAGFEMYDYVISLREGIMDAWGGITIAMRAGNKSDILRPYVAPIFKLLSEVWGDQNRSEALLRSCMGVMGDLSEAFPNGDFAEYFRNDWVLAMVKEVRGNRDFAPRTIDTARWTREQVKRQVNSSDNTDAQAESPRRLTALVFATKHRPSTKHVALALMFVAAASGALVCGHGLCRAIGTYLSW
ncbi:MAG: hypothetical protein M1825_004611 [Sarcosagium campestre]|nr:MAG: hypothetical protein M1825_004611 [Sarcosagium campestre]